MRGDKTDAFKDCCCASETNDLRKPGNKDRGCAYRNCRRGEQATPRASSKKDWTRMESGRVCEIVAAGSNNARGRVILDHETQTERKSVKEEGTAMKSDSRDVGCADDGSMGDHPEGARKGHDEFDMFGKSIAFQLRNMNFEIAIKLEKRIQDLIARERLDDVVGSKCVSHVVRSDCTFSCTDCKAIARGQMICSCGLPVIMINADPSSEFDCTSK